jgi:hyperosmotically inducible protein
MQRDARCGRWVTGKNPIGEGIEPEIMAIAMSFVWLRRFAIIGTIFFLALHHGLAGPATGIVPSFILRNQATRIIGLNLENTDGEKLGKIKDLAIVTPSGEVKYVLVSSGGLLGVAAHTKIVPAGAVSLATTKVGTACLEIGPRKWKTAPLFNQKSYAELSDGRHAAEIEQFYFGRNKAPAARRMAPTGAGAVHTGGPLVLRLASELVGRRVQGPGRENIGVLSDLLVDLQGAKPTFGIIWAHRQSRKDYTFAVAYHALGFDGIRFTTSANAAMLERASSFNPKVWAAPEPNAIYRYLMLDADNTAHNARDRNGYGLTPADQSEAEPDLQITSRVRQQLIGDDQLTFTAKNVKIITINGYVTLRGPVKHQFEKDMIQRKAERIAGDGKVKNLLEVEQE